MKTKIFNRMLRVSYGKIKIGLRTSMFTLVMMSMLMSSIGVGTSQVSAAPVGQGFNLNAADLRFIMAQIKIAETHTAAPGYACDALLGPGPLQVPSPVLPYGLRTVDGSCNNLQPGQSEFGAADNAFPRMLTPTYRQGENWAMDPDGPARFK